MLRDDGYCYACGKENPAGLHLIFQTDSDGNMVTEFTPERVHQGYAGIVHGGILATLADECMAQLLLAKRIDGLTARLEVAYKKPAEVGRPLKAVAKLIQEDRRLLVLSCVVLNEEGRCVTEVKGTFVRQSPERS